jgi:hypothetical protein
VAHSAKESVSQAVTDLFRRIDKDVGHDLSEKAKTIISPAQDPDLQGLISALQFLVETTQGSVYEACPKTIPDSESGQQNMSILLEVCGLERVAIWLERFNLFCDVAGKCCSELSKEGLRKAIIKVTTEVSVLTAASWLATHVVDLHV